MNEDIYGTRLCLSGGESRRLLDTFADFKVPHIQLSYYYMQKVFQNPSEAEDYLSRFETVIIDSGLIYHKYKGEEEKIAFLEDYAFYITHLDKSVYRAAVTHTEIPLEKVIDEERLIYPLDELEKTFEGDISAIFQQVPYVGISSKVATDDERMGYIMSQASKNHAKVHVFGSSAKKVLTRWPVYTANSSSWRTGSRYANTYLYEGPTRGLKIYQPTDKTDLDKTDREKKLIRTRLQNMVAARQPALVEHVDWDLLHDDNSWEVDKGNLTQWLLYQRDLELDGQKAYWLEEEEKKALATKRREVLGNATAGGDRAASGEEDIGPRRHIEDIEGVREEEDSIESPPIEAPLVEGEVVDADIVEEPANQDPNTSQELSTTQDSPLVIRGNERLRAVDSRMLSPRKCDFCILANRCPKYEAGAACAYGLTESYTPANIEGHIAEDVADLLAIQKDRILQGYLEEKADGAGLNKDLSREVRLYLEMVALNSEAMDKRDSLEIKAKGSGIMEMFKKR